MPCCRKRYGMGDQKRLKHGYQLSPGRPCAAKIDNHALGLGDRVQVGRDGLLDCSEIHRCSRRAHVQDKSAIRGGRDLDATPGWGCLASSRAWLARVDDARHRIVERDEHGANGLGKGLVIGGRFHARQRADERAIPVSIRERDARVRKLRGQPDFAEFGEPLRLDVWLATSRGRQCG